MNQVRRINFYRLQIRLPLPVSVEWRNWNGRLQVFAFPALHEVTLALHILLSVLSVTSEILQSDKSFLFVVSSLTRTTSPTERLGSRFCHFDLFWRFCRYYLFHLIQNWSARYCALFHHLRAYRSCGTKLPGWRARGRVFIVSCIAGVNGCGSWMSEGTAEMGRLLTFPVIPAPATRVQSPVKFRPVRVVQFQSAAPIRLQNGGLNIHPQPCSATNFWTRVWSISESPCSNCDFIQQC